MRAASVPVRLPANPLRSKRLLALADDERLVDQVRHGNEAAFEVVFERYGPAILGFCRHMLRSQEEAEDAVQHTFAAAHSALVREDGRDIALKAWLFAIARNRCLSMLRARREQPLDAADLGENVSLLTAGLAEEVQQRADLRELLEDLRTLPEDQRAALLLSELGDLSHAEVAGVLGCEAPKVKALVFRARSGLISRREAREMPCEEIREQLANLRGGSLRRSELRHHVAVCPGCREFRDQVRRQRQLLAVALPVVPGLGLKKSVLAAVGIGGGAAGGGGAAAGLGGLGAAFGSLGSATAAKVAVIGALAAGGAVAGTAVIDDAPKDGTKPAAAAAAAKTPSTRTAEDDLTASDERGKGSQTSAEHRAGARGRERRAVAADRARRRALGAERRSSGPGRKVGHESARERARGLARGPIETPPAQTPVRRGRVEPKAPPPKVEKVVPVEPKPVPVPEALPESAPEMPPAAGRLTRPSE